MRDLLHHGHSLCWDSDTAAHFRRINELHVVFPPSVRGSIRCLGGSRSIFVNIDNFISAAAVRPARSSHSSTAGLATARVMPTPDQRSFSVQDRWTRIIFLSALGIFALLLRGFEPGTIASWVPFRTSCGAVTGLPCLFCGLTRALHYLLNGEFGRALYFNWLAFPIAAGALFLFAMSAMELALGRRFFVVAPVFRMTPRTISIGAALLISLWVLQVYLAVSHNKRELLNPAGPLYTWFVK